MGKTKCLNTGKLILTLKKNCFIFPPWSRQRVWITCQMSNWLEKRGTKWLKNNSLNTSEAKQVNCSLVLISWSIVLIVLEWSNGNQSGGIIKTMRGACGAAVFPSQVFSTQDILIQSDKTRICLILLQACTLDYSRPTLLCLLSLCVKGADGASSRAYCSELCMALLGPHPVTKQRVRKCEECSRNNLLVWYFSLKYFLTLSDPFIWSVSTCLWLKVWVLS